MLRRWIQQLRHKPKAVRDNIALGVSGSITAVVLLAWLFVTPERVGTVAQSLNEGPGTFSLMFGRIKDQTATVVDSFRQLEGAIKEDVASSTSEEVLDSEQGITATTSATTSTSTTGGPIRTVRIATTTASSSPQ